MKMKMYRKWLGLLVAGGMMLEFGGCGSLANNIWTGFGYGIGGLPAGIITNLIADTLGITAE